MADDNGVSLVRAVFDGELALDLGLDIALVTRGLKQFNVRFGLDGDSVGGGSLSKLPLVVMLQLVVFLFDGGGNLSLSCLSSRSIVIDVGTISSLCSTICPPIKHLAIRVRGL
jgi:hypothetical protein